MRKFPAGLGMISVAFVLMIGVIFRLGSVTTEIAIATSPTPLYPNLSPVPTAIASPPLPINPNLRPPQFVDLQQVIPNIKTDIRYASSYNFVGQKIEGYNAPKCLLTQPTAEALKKVQAELNTKSLSLKVYDCYRPQKSVNHFVRWSKNLTDTKMKTVFYPNLDKKNLVQEGYISQQSGHSRGSTVDLTLVPLVSPPQQPYIAGRPFQDNTIDMGTPFDYFDPLTRTLSPHVTKVQLQNRLLLKTTMEKYGFQSLDDEWWHFTLKNELFPKTFFNFPVE